MIEKAIICQQEKLILTNQRVIYWEKEQTLILSDVHIGKTAHFRKHGIAIPNTVLQQDLQRLDRIIHHFSAKQIIVVGDLFHAGHNADVQLFHDWLIKNNHLHFVLIKGNHDKAKINLPLTMHTSHLDLGPFRFIHEPLEHEAFQICGHIHPGVEIKGVGKQYFRLPCYYVMKRQIVLPAFSLFTGLKMVGGEGMVYAFSERGIWEV